MGIKSGANNVSSIYVGTTPVKEVYRGVNLIFSSDRGNLSLWRYSNEVIPGKTLLYNYMGNWYNYSLYNGYNLATLSSNFDVYIPFGFIPVTGANIYYNNGSKAYGLYINNVTNVNYFTVSVTDMPTSAYIANRKASLDKYLPSEPITLYVPKCRGNAVINDWYNETSSGTTEANRNTPFRNNPNVINVDLQGVPFNNSSMYNAFYNCQNLTSVKNIPNSVTSMYGTFDYCYNLNQNIQIPNSVTNMDRTFDCCYNLNQNIKIPNSVTSMYGTFNYCNNLNQNIQIPNSVTNMANTFCDCERLNQNIQIPNSVTNMYRTFGYCYNLNQNIQIPNSVTNMFATFSSCSNLNQSIQIPNSVAYVVYTFSRCFNLNQNIQISNSVTNMYGTFNYCNNMSSWINILSANITCASYAFNVNNASCIPNVFLIYKYVNNVNTKTFNSVKLVYTNFAGGGAIAGTSPNRIRCWDDGANYSRNASGGYNGTHCILNNWHGNLDTFLNNNVPWTTPIVPEKLFLSNIPTALTYWTFQNNTVIKSVDIGSNIQWAGNVMGDYYYKNSKSYHYWGAFRGCYNLESLKGVVQENVKNITHLCDLDYNLKAMDVILPEGATDGRSFAYNTTNLQFSAPLPSTVIGLIGGYKLATKVTGNLKAPVIPPSVTTLVETFANRQENIGNLYILSPSLSNMSNIWVGAPNTFNKNVFIYYTYSNGTNTATYNLFRTGWNGWYNTSGNTASPMYSLSTNFYVYNLSTVYSNLWTAWSGVTANRVRLIKYKGNDPHVAVMAPYPDYLIQEVNINCFNNCRNIITLALYDYSISSETGDTISNLFRDCYNLRVVQGLNTTTGIYRPAGSITSNIITDMSNTYVNCYNLRVACPLGVNVVNAAYIYDNCRNLNFNCQLGSKATNLQGAFRNCVNLNRPIQIPNSAVDVSRMFQYCANLAPMKIIVPNNVENMYATFYGCTKLTNRIEVHSENVSNAMNCFNISSGKKEVHIPYRYSNGEYTKTFNAFYTAGYIDNNGISTGMNGTTFYNLVV